MPSPRGTRFIELPADVLVGMIVEGDIQLLVNLEEDWSVGVVPSVTDDFRTLADLQRRRIPTVALAARELAQLARGVSILADDTRGNCYLITALDVEQLESLLENNG